MTDLPPIAILAGGLATRMRPHTEKVPKALLEVAGEPFIFHQVRLLRDAGITKIVMLIGYLGEMIVDALGDGSDFGVQVAYKFDGDKLLGTGGAIKAALPMLGERFFITYGDAYLQTDYAAAAQKHLDSGKQGLMVVYHNRGKWDASNVIYRDGEPIRYDKFDRTPEMEHIDW
ncbi:MAG: sugar phosphate nucleotidyltransferase, partial [Chloroflexota bacterium]